MRHLSAVFSVLVITASLAAPLSAVEVEELVDFGGSLGSPTLIEPPLDFGTNTITGSLPVEGQQNDTDVIQVQLPAYGRDLLSVKIAVRDFVPAGDNPGRLELYYPAEGNTGALNIRENGTYDLTFTLENPDNVVFRLIGPRNFINNSVGSFNYTLFLEVPWGAFAVVNNEWTYTGDWLGWIQISETPWVWRQNPGEWVYVPPFSARAGSGWNYNP